MLTILNKSIDIANVLLYIIIKTLVLTQTKGCKMYNTQHKIRPEFLPVERNDCDAWEPVYNEDGNPLMFKQEIRAKEFCLEAVSGTVSYRYCREETYFPHTRDPITDSIMETHMTYVEFTKPLFYRT